VNNEAPLTAHELAIRDHLPIRVVNQLVGRMVETGVVSEVIGEDEEEKTFQPALDTHKISIGMVLDRIDAQGAEEFLASPTPEMQAFWERYIKVKKNHTTLNEILITEI